MKTCWNFGCAVEAAKKRLVSAEHLSKNGDPEIAEMLLVQADCYIKKADQLKISPKEDGIVKELRRRKMETFRSLPCRQRARHKIMAALDWLNDMRS